MGKLLHKQDLADLESIKNVLIRDNYGVSAAVLDGIIKNLTQLLKNIDGELIDVRGKDNELS